MATSDQLEVTEQARVGAPFPAGIYQYHKRPDANLAGKAGSEGCLPLGPQLSSSSNISPIPNKESTVAVQGSPIWTEYNANIPIHPVCPDSLLLEQAGRGESCRSADSPSLAEPSLVPSAAQTSDRSSHTSAPCSEHDHEPRGSESPSGVGSAPSTGHLAHLRRHYHAAGLSEQVIHMLRKSWKNWTESSYSNAWRLLDHWCLRRDTDPLSAPVSNIPEFQFEARKQYRTLNSIRLAIAMTHSEVDGKHVGEHPLVSRFLKGVFNCCPSKPKYTTTWNMDVVLTYLKTLPENEDVSFQLFSHKVALLMALANADKCSDLAALELGYRSFQENGVRFIIPRLTKTRRMGPPIEAFYVAFPEDPTICPIQALWCYEGRSEGLRLKHQTAEENLLLISVHKPHKPVKPAMIGHWLKSCSNEGSWY